MNVRKLFVEETNNTGIQFFRSLFVGGLATAVDMAVLILFRELAGMPESRAAVFGFITGLACNYIVSAFWVFAKAKVKNRVLDFVGFAVIGIIGLGLTQLIIEPFAVKGMFGTGFFVSNAVFGKLIPTDKYYIIGKTIAVVIVYMWNFFARKFILYRNSELPCSNTEKNDDGEHSEINSRPEEKID